MTTSTRMFQKNCCLSAEQRAISELISGGDMAG